MYSKVLKRGWKRCRFSTILQRKSTIQYHFCRVSIIRKVSAKYGNGVLTINGLRGQISNKTILHGGDTSSTIKKFQPLILSGFYFLMVERSRKTSLHAASAALHSKPKVFFTSSPIPGSLACEVVPLRCRVIAFVKPLISFACEVAASGGRMCYLYSAALPLNFSTSKLIAAEHSSSGIFNQKSSDNLIKSENFIIPNPYRNLSKIGNPQL